jgi:hypothetical protein
VWNVTHKTYVDDIVNLFCFLNHELNYFTVSGDALHMNSFISKNDTTPIMVVVPGLTSDSASAVSSLSIYLFFTLICNYVSQAIHQ